MCDRWRRPLARRRDNGAYLLVSHVRRAVSGFYSRKVAWTAVQTNAVGEAVWASMSSVRVVLLHALPFDERMWQAERDLAPGMVIAPSLYRLGETLEDRAYGVLALVGDEPFVVVGCSAGGSCALEVAPSGARPSSGSRAGRGEGGCATRPGLAGRSRLPAFVTGLCCLRALIDER